MLTGKNILVTGGASGIGSSTCQRLLEAGANVAIWDQSESEIDKTLSALAVESERCRGFVVDVTDASQVKQSMADTVAAFGTLHGAFNNAGIGSATVPTAEISEQDFDRVVAVDLKGVWLCMQQELLQLQQQGGAIVNNASVAGLVALAGQAAYTASKHGVIGLTKAAAVEYAPAKIRVNAVCPGAVRTPILAHLEEAGVDESALAAMAPQARIAEPDEIARAVVWLLSDQASFVTGAAVPVDGGWSAQ